MDKDLKQEIEGKEENLKGRAKEAVGAATGDKKTQGEGLVERIAGAAREKIAEVKRDLSKHREGRSVEEADDE
ncbi:MAG TPA: CsbD family protein [Polyangia bacterium]|nr:CsbD family protein [Polyangia bacterium]